MVLIFDIQIKCFFTFGNACDHARIWDLIDRRFFSRVATITVLQVVPRIDRCPPFLLPRLYRWSVAPTRPASYGTGEGQWDKFDLTLMTGGYIKTRNYAKLRCRVSGKKKVARWTCPRNCAKLRRNVDCLELAKLGQYFSILCVKFKSLRYLNSGTERTCEKRKVTKCYQDKNGSRIGNKIAKNCKFCV